MVTSALSHAQAELARVEKLGERIEDLQAMVELAEEEEGDEREAILDEAGADLEAISKDLADLEIRTLLSGEYDQRDAVVTIRSGAGGVDAADFAQCCYACTCVGLSATNTRLRCWTPPTLKKLV